MPPTVEDLIEHGDINAAERATLPDPDLHEPDSPGAHSVSESLCDLIQDSDESAYQLAKDTGLSPEAVCYHRNGECSHEHAPKLDSGRCALARILHAEDDIWFTEMAEMAPFEGYDHETLRGHVQGECSCDPRVEPVEKSWYVDAEECERMNELSDRGRSNPVIGTLVNRPRETVWRHVTGRCQHQ